MNNNTKTVPGIPGRVTEIGSQASLKGINLVQCRCEVLGVLPAGQGLPELKVDIRAGGEKHKSEPNTLVCGFGLDVTGLGPKPESIPVARLSCDYAVQYSFVQDEFFKNLDEKDADQFAAYNSSVHVWPHIRELIHSMSMRMGLPPILLPLFRPAVELGESDEAAPKG